MRDFVRFGADASRTQTPGALWCSAVRWTQRAFSSIISAPTVSRCTLQLRRVLLQP